MSPQPVEVDIAVGISGERCGFHLETMAHIVPHEFVAQVQGFIESLLWPQASTPVEEHDESSQTGSVVSDGGAAVESSRAAAPKSPRAPKPAARSISRVQDRLTQRGVEVA